MNRLRKSPIIWFPVCLSLLLAVLTVVRPPVIDGHLETLLVDFRFKIRNLFRSTPVPDDILLVVVDEASLSAYGRWPWGRTRQADLIRRVLDGDPKVVAVDIFYPESETPESDRGLADLFAAHRDRLVLALGFDVEKGQRYEGDIPEVLYGSTVSRLERLSLLNPIDASAVLLPPSPIDGSAFFGHVYTLPDRDGKLRWEILSLRYGEEFFPSLALKTACKAMGIPFDEMRLVGGMGVRLGEKQIRTDAHGRVHINYYGREGTFPSVSAAEVLSGDLLSSFFREKVVLIGTTAIATYDLKSTPFSANMSGVEKNATVVANLLQGNVIQPVPVLLDVGIVCLLGVFVSFVGVRYRALPTLVVLLVAAGLFFVVNVLLFACENILLNLFLPLLMVLGGGGFTISYRVLIEEKNAREIRRIFSSYVTERVVNELITKPHLARLGGEKREVTVLFSDIRDFTRFCENREPEEVISMLNDFLTAMTEVIFRWEGTLDKFVGDEIMAFWGAPLSQENHAELAVRCAMNMVKRLETLREEWRAQGKEPLDMGIGINTGEVVVGNIGAEGKKMDYTIIGDHVNLGARLESLTRELGTPLLLSAFTVEKVRPLFENGRFGHCRVTQRGEVMVKGRARPVGIYALEPREHGEPCGIEEGCARPVGPHVDA